MSLNVDSLRKSIAVLHRSLEVAEAHKDNEDLKDTLRSGVIQNFEVAYEQCWKMMKRWLEMNISSTTADGVTRRELFRLIAENRMIDDVEQWMRYHEARNQTSHIYEPEVAENVYAVTHGFARDGLRFLQALETRND
ncbi:MAG: nucleotidyltransferase [Nitrospinae bacterium CG22_combo_CG10-13_8_21_14_all_47_10]|nr:MAG: nucleotidyltransferase [Nitrospinae bacterium CG22_combo_CG10-13_8_21_14_all_47_10]